MLLEHGVHRWTIILIILGYGAVVMMIILIILECGAVGMIHISTNQVVGEAPVIHTLIIPAVGVAENDPSNLTRDVAKKVKDELTYPVHACGSDTFVA